jgi:subtilisin family serine protease
VKEYSQRIHRITGVHDLHANELFGDLVKVGMIDSGVNYRHSALGGCFGNGCKVAYGYDFADNDKDPMDW